MTKEQLDKGNELANKIRDFENALNCFEWKFSAQAPPASTNPRIIIEYDDYDDVRSQIALPMNRSDTLVDLLKSTIKEKLGKAQDELDKLWLLKPKLPFSTIGVSKFNPADPRHIRLKQKRDEYRANMQEGIRLSEFKDLFFTCSRCGHTLPIQVNPCYDNCGACGQWFQFTYKKVKEYEPPVHLLKDPAQLAIHIPDHPP